MSREQRGKGPAVPRVAVCLSLQTVSWLADGESQVSGTRPFTQDLAAWPMLRGRAYRSPERASLPPGRAEGGESSELSEGENV